MIISDFDSNARVALCNFEEASRKTSHLMNTFKKYHMGHDRTNRDLTITFNLQSARRIVFVPLV